ncbi:hypothetical protein Cgig2_028583 [Carnegiea gigantea]|uniref:Uncharacterized protein n=1 Tax=Carnegiea gigantea TaxID=171969 RepID=A0A9Q1JXP9_9CARY|nr:hypothetical protein Cgig2_028583 [Carnegiea gigantea]
MLLVLKSLKEIPACFIVDRWTKVAAKKAVFELDTIVSTGCAQVWQQSRMISDAWARLYKCMDFAGQDLGHEKIGIVDAQWIVLTRVPCLGNQFFEYLVHRKNSSTSMAAIPEKPLNKKKIKFTYSDCSDSEGDDDNDDESEEDNNEFDRLAEGDKDRESKESVDDRTSDDRKKDDQHQGVYLSKLTIRKLISSRLMLKAKRMKNHQ